MQGNQLGYIFKHITKLYSLLGSTLGAAPVTREILHARGMILILVPTLINSEMHLHHRIKATDGLLSF